MKDKLFNVSFKRPAVICAVLAILLTYSSIYIGTLTAVLLFVNTVAAILFFIFKKYKKVIVFLILSTVSLILVITYQKINSIHKFCDKTIYGEFIVCEDTTDNDSYTFLRIKAANGDLPSGTFLEPIYNDNKSLKAGDIVSANIKIKKIPNEQIKTYYSEDVYVYSTVKDLDVLSKKDLFYSFIGSIRRYIKNAYLKYCSRSGGSMLIAITLGDKSYLSKNLDTAIRNVGASHMVAVSGFHLAIILGNAFYLINYLIKNKYLRFVLCLLSVILMAGVCGFTKSILRAGSMFVISSSAILFDREPDSLSSLSLSIVAVTLISPFSIFNIGFNLSVIATFAIIYISPYFIKAIQSFPVLNNKYAFPFVSLVINSFFAALFSMPAVIKIFGKVSVVSVFTNLFLNYVVTFALVFGAIAVALLPIAGGLTAFIFKIADFFSGVMIYIIKGLNDLPFVTLKLGETSYYLFLGVIIITTFYVYFKNRINSKGEWC